ncbi:MAG: diguanylate cyclase (GGDEF)-like protein [Afipia broomeae]|jgi:diguanylate cyclase (GGDEF)-like protein|nr:MAG: GGDEF domain-containing protein [Bradyrhizobiaceae bacterium]
MRDADHDPSAELTSKGIDQVAEWLDRRSDPQAWALIIGSAAIVAALDFSTHAFELCIATLYIVPICLASWMFRAHTAIAVTVVITFVAFLKYPLLHDEPRILTTIYNGTSRAFAFLLLTAIMLAFRRSHDRARIAATHDLMTGALNKQTFHEQTLALLSRTNDTVCSVLLLYLDIDGFKAVNDLHGHHIGDEVLRSFSTGASKALRRGDCFGRLGGDEFGAAIIVEPSDQGQKLADHLHKRFSEALAASGHSVTCSMGALIVPAGSRFACADLMREADRLMYASKNRGKNAVTIATAIRATEDEHRRVAAPSVVPHFPLRIDIEA